MKMTKLKKYILQQIELDELYIKGDEKHIHIIAIGKIFTNMNSIKKQQIIYKPLTKYIIKKKIHAVTIDTFTQKEWKKSNLYYNMKNNFI